MIRLDGNSLAAFRGAGVAGTVQSVAGCELFGAARMPSWASPYSAAATTALKAQFPTQWPTIRDYGVSHPEIVGYMNAYAPEDAKIAYSLVEGIGTRWLLSSGESYIATTIIPTYDLCAEVKVIFSGAKWLYGSRKTNVNHFGCLYGGSALQFDYGTTRHDHSYSPIVMGSEYILKQEINHCYVNGVENTFARQDVTYSYPLYLFALNREGTLVANSNATKITYERFYRDGTNIALFVPYKKNGAMGMIDLLTGTFYGNANSSGSFTESIDSPA